MSKFQWKLVVDTYIASFKQGKATIQAVKQNRTLVYMPSLEDAEGKAVKFEWEIESFDSFTAAEAFIDMHLGAVDGSTDNPARRDEKYSLILDMCIALFSEPDRMFHRRRLENIKQWFGLTAEQPNTNRSDLPLTDWSVYQFDWREQGNQFRAGTSPHGISVISEERKSAPVGFSFGNAPRYSVRIEDKTGAILKDYYVPSLDFLEAEARLREILDELETPYINEVYMDQISFTLEICRRLLPPDTDTMDLYWLDEIDARLGESLP